MRNQPRQCPRHLTMLCLALTLCACATSPQGRQKISSPAAISDVYAEVEMRVELATTVNFDMPCSDQECELNRAFDAQVQQVGKRIAAAAYVIHPDLIDRIRHIDFEVAEKNAAGITSNASGKIVILRGTQQIGLNDGALAFVIAREMGHVIAQHHEENTTTRIVLSVAAGLLFPAIDLFSHVAAFAQATSASTATAATLATTAASSATSYLGAKLIINRQRPEQLNEADQVALNLLEAAGWSHQDLAQALDDSAAFESSNTWSEEFLLSTEQVKTLAAASSASELLPEILPQDDDIELAETDAIEAVESDTSVPVAEVSPPSLPQPIVNKTLTLHLAKTLKKHKALPSISISTRAKPGKNMIPGGKPVTADSRTTRKRETPA